ncbi:hypothetical protein SOVF_163200 [Spinacia oleracea]|nr:hypothetical protein SOVF_163200 [Spinacia oleracea]
MSIAGLKLPIEIAWISGSISRPPATPLPPPLELGFDSFAAYLTCLPANLFDFWSNNRLRNRFRIGREFPENRLINRIGGGD